MDRTRLNKSIELIKECEGLKLKIDELVKEANDLSNTELNDTRIITISGRKKEEKPIDDEYGESPLMKNILGLTSWSVGMAYKQGDKSSDFKYESNVCESLIILSALISFNRERLTEKINKLKKLGVNV